MPKHHICDDLGVCENYEDKMGCGFDHIFECPTGEVIESRLGVVRMLVVVLLNGWFISWIKEKFHGYSQIKSCLRTHSENIRT